MTTLHTHLILSPIDNPFHNKLARLICQGIAAQTAAKVEVSLIQWNGKGIVIVEDITIAHGYHVIGRNSRRLETAREQPLSYSSTLK